MAFQQNEKLDKPKRRKIPPDEPPEDFRILLLPSLEEVFKDKEPATFSEELNALIELCKQRRGWNKAAFATNVFITYSKLTQWTRERNIPEKKKPLDDLTLELWREGVLSFEEQYEWNWRLQVARLATKIKQRYLYSNPHQNLIEDDIFRDVYELVVSLYLTYGPSVLTIQTEEPENTELPVDMGEEIMGWNIEHEATFEVLSKWNEYENKFRSEGFSQVLITKSVTEINQQRKEQLLEEHPDICEPLKDEDTIEKRICMRALYYLGLDFPYSTLGWISETKGGDDFPLRIPGWQIDYKKITDRELMKCVSVLLSSIYQTQFHTTYNPIKPEYVLYFASFRRSTEMLKHIRRRLLLWPIEDLIDKLVSIMGMYSGKLPRRLEDWIKWDKWQIVKTDQTNIGDLIIVESTKEPLTAVPEYLSPFGVRVHKDYFINLLHHHKMANIHIPIVDRVLPFYIWEAASLRKLSEVNIIKAFRPWVPRK